MVAFGLKIIGVALAARVVGLKVCWESVRACACYRIICCFKVMSSLFFIVDQGNIYVGGVSRGKEPTG